MKKFKIKSPEELAQVVSYLKSKIKLPTLVLLEGQLGSGKTTLTKHLAEQFGLSKNQIKSPTFTLINSYELEGNLQFHHLDLYRLENLDHFFEESLKEIFIVSEVLVVIEWPEKIYSMLDKISDYKIIKILIEYDGQDERVLTIHEL